MREGLAAAPVATRKAHAKPSRFGASIVEVIAMLAVVRNDFSLMLFKMGDRRADAHLDRHGLIVIMNINLGSRFCRVKIAPVRRHSLQTISPPDLIDWREVAARQLMQIAHPSVASQAGMDKSKCRIDREVKIGRSLWLRVVVGQVVAGHSLCRSKKSTRSVFSCCPDSVYRVDY